jgi:hypothetical protein
MGGKMHGAGKCMSSRAASRGPNQEKRLADASAATKRVQNIETKRAMETSVFMGQLRMGARTLDEGDSHQSRDSRHDNKINFT